MICDLRTWFGAVVISSAPLGRTGQPAAPAPSYVLLASDEASYVTGARVAVTGDRPIL